MVVKDVEREDIEFISKTLHCLPVRRLHCRCQCFRTICECVCMTAGCPRCGASPCASSAVHVVHADRAVHSAQIAHVDHMRPEKLGQAELCEEVDVS
jgi:hypothetical protein